ncbi:endolytic transglycosylase MltG [Aestuariibacter sp. A3R04]|uniref:endolytic transglycosylase MltG n=1 Tax=Aestuariibacter sp. A3R04 TaxID=2841571 RepID=UPI001C09D034|nr:endolytic transglycosylase MltG [Aestuariibacter sp. A3R04]MBU3022724.1 endolytic transglycosylase MltG [Aestuariibacter sp. A3R04]
MKWITGVVVFVILAVSATIAVAVWGVNALHSPMNIKQPVLFTVESGMSPLAVSEQLIESDLTSLPTWLPWVWFKLEPDISHIQAGTYEVTPRHSFATLFADMNAGKVRQFSVSLIEGLTLRQWVDSLIAQPHLVDDTDGDAFAGVTNVDGMPEGVYPEGIFLADTYYYTAGTKVSQVLERANRELVEFLSQAWQERDTDLPLNSPYEALILASIIEKETAVANERSLIAGVFVNRLNRKMRLQTDPTIIYGLGERYEGDIKYAHLREKTAYNTYVIKGLPPTPIAMPGREAILAALHPQQTEALYFVAKGDGSHVFSSTLDAHNDAVNQYQRNQGQK